MKEDEHNEVMKKDLIKIRDARNHGRFVIEDKVIDRKAREIGPTALAVYAVLCRHAGITQEAYPSHSTIGEKLGIGSKNTIIRAIKKLEQAGMIAVTRERNEKTKRQKVNVYTILDLQVSDESRVQKMNPDPGSLFEQKPGSKNEPEGYTEMKDTHNAERAESAPAHVRRPRPEDPIPDWEKYLEGMDNAKRKDGTDRRDLPMIAQYFRERGIRFRTYGQASAAIKRHLRAAKALEPFDDDQILWAYEKAKREYPHWTLETALKILTR
jgi:DNA-binding MarR family transcriptional regulator